MAKEIWETDKPIFENDCDSCRFLGNYFNTSREVHDLYICTDNTIIRRYGNEGSDYVSAALEGAIRVSFNNYHNEAYHEAIKRAVSKGYLTDSEIGVAYRNSY